MSVKDSTSSGKPLKPARGTPPTSTTATTTTATTQSEFESIKGDPAAAIITTEAGTKGSAPPMPEIRMVVPGDIVYLNEEFGKY
jgi:hypothetical protein